MFCPILQATPSLPPSSQTTPCWSKIRLRKFRNINLFYRVFPLTTWSRRRVYVLHGNALQGSGIIYVVAYAIAHGRSPEYKNRFLTEFVTCMNSDQYLPRSEFTALMLELRGIFDGGEGLHWAYTRFSDSPMDAVREYESLTRWSSYAGFQTTYIIKWALYASVIPRTLFRKEKRWSHSKLFHQPL